MNKNTLILALAILVLLAGSASYYFYRQASELKADPQAQSSKEAQELVAKVGALIELPLDEEPTIATVSDPEKLKGQAFFERAKAGDKVLLYTKAKKAYLYDPAANKIIEVAPLAIGSDTPASTQ